MVMKTHKRKKYIAILIILIFALAILCTGCDEESHTCAQCKKTTTDCKQYKTDNGTELYYCKSCRETCAFCGAEASKHYTNSVDMEVFVCKDCYSKMKDEE